MSDAAVTSSAAYRQRRRHPNLGLRVFVYPALLRHVLRLAFEDHPTDDDLTIDLAREAVR